MGISDRAVKRLKEYGITSAKELDTAIAELGEVDISVFCAKPETSKSTY